MKGLNSVTVADEKRHAETMKTRKAESKPKNEKACKTKNTFALKRPQCAFLLFMEDFRTMLKESNPDYKSLGSVVKAGSEKWKAMTEAEKAPYAEKSASNRAEYEKALEAHKKQLADSSASVSEDSSKSASEIQSGKTSTSEIYDEDEQEVSSHV